MEAKRKEGLGSLDKYKNNKGDLSPQMRKPSKFKTLLLPKPLEMKSNRSSTHIPMKSPPSIHKRSSKESPSYLQLSIPNMLLDKSVSIKKKLREDLVSFKREERKEFPTVPQRINLRKTAPNLLKERKSMPEKNLMIMKNFENDEEESPEENEEVSILEKIPFENQENSNDSNESSDNLSIVSNEKDQNYIKGFYSDSYLNKRSANDKISE